MKKQMFNITGMHCISCKALLELQVGDIEGVHEVMVNFEKKTMHIEFDDSKIDTLLLKKTVAGTGDYTLIE